MLEGAATALQIKLKEATAQVLFYRYLTQSLEFDFFLRILSLAPATQNLQIQLEQQQKKDRSVDKNKSKKITSGHAEFPQNLADCLKHARSINFRRSKVDRPWGEIGTGKPSFDVTALIYGTSFLFMPYTTS